MTAPLLSGRYRLHDEIGRGGMSTVYEATDEVLKRNVAVKLLDLDQATTLDAKARFRREAQIAASLNHPNIVTIYDTGVDGTTAFIVMELLTGPTLVERVARTGSLTLPEVRNVGEQVCRALSAAHAAGVVHRDIKPSNVAYSGDETVKVLDFGVARMIEASTGQTELTRTAILIGTAAYLSPEQARGDPVSPSTDLYAFGCLLFALVTGGPPFHGESALAVCSQHLYKEPPLLSSLADGVPLGLSELVDDLLKKNPADRPADAEQVRLRLISGVAKSPENNLTALLPIVEEKSQVMAETEPLPVGAGAAPSTITEELVATRQYPSDTTSSMARPRVPPADGTFDSVGEDSSVVSTRRIRASHRWRWATGVALVVALVITLVILAPYNAPPRTPSLPTITVPAPQPGASPLPIQLIRSLNNLARSVTS